MSENWLSKNWTIGEVNALIKNLGEENARIIQRGEVVVRFEEAIRTLFDKTGRRIPQGLEANTCDPDRDFKLVQPTMVTLEDYAGRLKRLRDYLGIDTGITAEEFKQGIERQLEMVHSDPRVANLAKGVCLPLILPKLETADLGEALEKYLKALEKSYLDNFPNRKFNNYRKGELKDKVSVAESTRSTRYGDLIERMKQRPVVAIYFPNSLQGFSINASREQVESLPESFAVSGFEAVIAAVMYSEILLRDFHTPGFDLAAFCWRSAAYSLCLGAGGGDAAFDRGGDFAYASGGYSAGLVFFG